MIQPQSMNTGLTPETDQTIINLAHAFDGYAYAKKAWQLAEERVQSTLAERLQQTQQTGRLAVRVADNFALNFYLHRGFHHQGWLPAVRSPHWYDMLFFYLHLYRAPIPTAHQHPSMYSHWAKRPAGSAEAAAAEIRQMLRRKE
jgi:hypothetical protein